MESKYKIVRNKYLAEGLAFIGFKYEKHGFGKDTEYRFTWSKELSDAIGQILKIQAQYIENK